MNILQNVTNALTGTNIPDQIIASDMISAGKLSAMCLTDHYKVSQIAIELGWYKAYASPEEILQQDLKLSQPMAQQAQQ